mmetsp:Transcript_9602/g.11235  ORF Transcript_9602/g.11235 Transcript_9602/m.11235 type:complete len:539 (+) Transcript_9602:120-1736(+)
MLSDSSSISSQSTVYSDVEDVTPDQFGGPPEAPLIRERFPYNAAHQQSHFGSKTAGPIPPAPQGYSTSAPVNTYQRYTFILVCCLAITSFVQIISGGYSGGQRNALNRNDSFKNKSIQGNNNGVNSPYYYNNGNGMEGRSTINMNRLGDMQQNSAMLNNDNNNNMMQVNGNGNDGEENIQNQQDGGGDVNFLGSGTEVVEMLPVEAVVSDPGMERYPLTELSHFKDNWDEWEETDVPMFLNIPKPGGSTVLDIMVMCHRVVAANEIGIQNGHADDQEIAVVSITDGYPVVNVDTTTVEGISRAQQMGFADSGLAGAVVTHLLYEANELFTTTAKGRIFTVFRHPIERAISMYSYMQVADWEPNYNPSFKEMTIEEYAESPFVENNWLTRQLSNTPEGDLTDVHLNLAMEVVRRKVIVGLMSEIEATMERFERFFRWTYHVNPPNQENCRESLLGGGSNSNSKNKKEKPVPGSEAWELLSWQNNYDLQLYEYVESLFVEQEAFVADIEVGYRNKDATCCKCDPATFPPEGFTCPLAILF